MSNGVSSGRVESKVVWDKKKDIVEIDSKQFDRADGSLFVIAKSPGATGDVWQRKLPAAIVRVEDVLDFAKKELTDVKAVQDATLDVKVYERRP